MQLVVDVNEDLLKKFRRFAVGKHGKLYNALKPEVELALKNHLTNQQSRTDSLEKGDDV
jgi:hypothetical protein